MVSAQGTNASHGTLKTAFEGLSGGVLMRQNSKLKYRKLGEEILEIEILGDKLSAFKLSRAVGLDENKIKTVILLFISCR